MNAGRDTMGRFTKGNACSPGRPRRATERDYLTKFSDAVSLDDWEEIIKRTVEDAKKGDRHSRDFIAKYVLGENVGSLQSLAAKEAVGISAKHEIVHDAHEQRTTHLQLLNHRLGTTPEAMERICPIRVAELASDSSSGSQNGASKQPPSECNNKADYVILQLILACPGGWARHESKRVSLTPAKQD